MLVALAKRFHQELERFPIYSHGEVPQALAERRVLLRKGLDRPRLVALGPLERLHARDEGRDELRVRRAHGVLEPIWLCLPTMSKDNVCHVDQI